MDISTVAIKLVEFAEYRDTNKIKELLVENVGRFYTFAKTEDFFNKYPIVGLDKLSKREKNMFSFLLKDNPYAEDIVNEYNQSVSNFGQMKDRVDFLKKLNSINELLKAHPYSEPEFAKSVLKKSVEWGFEDNTENLRLLQKSFNLFADKALISNFIGTDTIKKKESFALLRGIEGADKTAEIKSSLLVGSAGVMSIGLMSMANPIVEMSNKILPKVTEFVGTNPLISNISTGAVVAGVAAFAFYKTFQLVNKTIKTFVEKEREKQIRFCLPEKNNLESANSLISNKILGSILHVKNFENNKENKDYLALCAFVVEKLKNPTVTVPSEMKKDLSLNDRQVSNLNNLDVDKIHELYLISNPMVRRSLLLDDISEKDKYTFKTISILADVAGVKPNEDGILFRYLDSIRNLSGTLKNKIEKLSETNQKLVTSYLLLNTDENNLCSQSVMKNLYNNFGNNKKIAEILNTEIELSYFNKQVAAPKNEEVAYFKKIWNWVTNKEEITVINDKTKDMLKEITDKYQLGHANFINEANPSLLGKAKDINVTVLETIQKMRTSVTNTISRNLAP